jgi:hypothetical protein
MSEYTKAKEVDMHSLAKLLERSEANSEKDHAWDTRTTFKATPEDEEKMYVDSILNVLNKELKYFQVLAIVTISST